MSHDDEPLLGGRGHHASGVKKLRIILIACALIIVALVAVVIWQATDNHTLKKKVTDSLPPQYTWLKDDISSKMDTTADPCDDFYSYVCGAYVKNTNLAPGEYIRMEVFDGVQATNDQILFELANGQWPLIGDLYTSCTADSTSIDQQSTAGVLALLAPVVGLTANSSMSDIFAVLAQLHRVGSDAFFTPQVQNDIFTSPSTNYLMLGEGGFSESTDNVTAIEESMVSTISKFYPDFTLTRAKAIHKLEGMIEANQFPEPQTYQEYFVIQQLANLTAYSGVDYKQYTDNLGLNLAATDNLIVAVPEYFKTLANLINSTNIQTLQDYFIWRTINALNNFPLFNLDSTLTAADSFKAFTKAGSLKNKKSGFVNYNRQRKSLEDITDQQAACISSVDALLSDFVGLLFSTKVLDPSIVAAIREVTIGVQTAFNNSLDALSWLDAASNAQTKEKLANIIQIIGHPNKLDRYRNITLDPTNFFNNVVLLTQVMFDYTMADVNTPFNRADFEFDPTIVNAFYSPLTNTINFPAGILESPMYSVDFPKMLQYARMGYVIGHETTHGFDTSGSNFDGNGTLRNIIDDNSLIAFENGAQCIIDQFDAFNVVPGLNVNGEQTIGENIADLGGVKNSFRAYKAWVAANKAEFEDGQVVKGLTNDQLFFVMLGQTWCTKASDIYLIYQVYTDPHAPSQFRVNGPLSNFDQFAKAFQCKAGSKMVHNPQCVLW